MNEEEKRIKFPEKHYVGFQTRKEHVNLGFMTPYGTDSAAKKRMGTVDKWAKGYQQYDYTRKEYIKTEQIPPVVYDNAPLNGFIVSNPVNHSSSWNSCNDKWRIEDPRGFELEITSGNLEKIMETCNILRGVIQEDCIWARLGAENILVPVESELYKTALTNTNRFSSNVKISEVEPGSWVELQNGEIYYYIGRYHLIDYETNIDRYYNKTPPDSDELISLTVTPKKYYIFEQLTKDYRNATCFFAIAGPKIAAVKKGISFDDGEKYINKKLSEQNNSIHSNIGYGHIGVTSNLEITHNKERVTGLTLEDAKKLGFRYAFVDIDQDTLGMFHLNLSDWVYRENKIEGYRVDRETLDLKDPFVKGGTYYSSSFSRRKIPIPVQDFYSCYKVIINTGNSTINKHI